MEVQTVANTKFSHNNVIAILFILGLYIQIPIPYMTSNFYLQASDILILLSSCSIGMIVIKKSVLWDKILQTFPNLRYWVIGSIVIFTISLLRGWYQLGCLSSWALFNKYIGWYVLLAYAVFGYILGVDNGSAQVKKYFHVLWFMAIVLTLYHIIAMCEIIFCEEKARLICLKGLLGSRLRFCGLLLNPNAMGFLLLSGYICALNFPAMIKDKFYIALITMQILGILFTSSKVVVMLAIVATVYSIFLMKSNRKHILTSVSFASIIFIGIEYLLFNPIGYVEAEYRTYLDNIGHVQWGVDLYNHTAPLEMGSMSSRIDVYKKSWELILQSPVLGIGLGSFLGFQSSLISSNSQTIHNIFLWIWSELGIIMLILMVLAIARLLKYGFQQYAKGYQSRNPEQIAWANCLIMQVISWCIMSQVHEVLYQRSFWFLAAFYIGRLMNLHAKSKVSSNDPIYDFYTQNTSIR